MTADARVRGDCLLITVHDQDGTIKDSGTGFVIDRKGDKTFVATCSHVVDPHNRQGVSVRVNGGVADQNWRSGRDIGVDLAVLEVSGLPSNLRPITRGRPESGMEFGYLGFAPFVRGEFIAEAVKGKLGNASTVRVAGQDRELTYWPLAIPKNAHAKLKKGHSGAPIFDEQGRAVAVARLRETDGLSGFALDLQALDLIMPDTDAPKPLPPRLPSSPDATTPRNGGSGRRKSPAAARRAASPPSGAVESVGTVMDDTRSQSVRVPKKNLDGMLAELGVRSETTPKDLPPKNDKPTDKKDTQKGRWGGVAVASGRELSVKIGAQQDSGFAFEAIVESTDGSNLNGPVYFHLHDTFPSSVIQISRVVGRRVASLGEIWSYGSFTIGAEVRDATGKWISLEYDIASHPHLAKRFRDI